MLPINSLRPSSGFYNVWKRPPLGHLSNSKWSSFELEHKLPRAALGVTLGSSFELELLQGPPPRHMLPINPYGRRAGFITFGKKATLGSSFEFEPSLSNSNCPKQASKGRPHSSYASYKQTGRRADFITFGKRPTLGSSFELELSFFELELSKTSFQGPLVVCFLETPYGCRAGFITFGKKADPWVLFQTRTVQNKLPRAAPPPSSYAYKLLTAVERIFYK